MSFDEVGGDRFLSERPPIKSSRCVPKGAQAPGSQGSTSGIDHPRFVATVLPARSRQRGTSSSVRRFCFASPPLCLGVATGKPFHDATKPSDSHSVAGPRNLDIQRFSHPVACGAAGIIRRSNGDR